MAQVHIGLDSGNGTNMYVSKELTPNGQLIKHEGGFLAGYNTSPGLEKAVRELELGGPGNGLSKSDLQFLNAGYDDFLVNYKGRDYYLGLSAHMLSDRPVKYHDERRYIKTRYMALSIHGAIAGLMKSNFRFDKENDLYISFGIPTEWYYKEGGGGFQMNALKAFCRAINGTKFVIDNVSFSVLGSIITPEGIGAYYDDVLDDDLSIKGDPSKSTLVVDIGHGTLDTMIIKNFTVAPGGGEVKSTKKTSTKNLFRDAAHIIDIDGFSGPEVESLFINPGNDSRYDVGHNELNGILKGLLEDTLLEKVDSRLSELYSDKAGFFQEVLIIGGAISICDKLGVDIEDHIYVNGIKPYIGKISQNASGFEKAIRNRMVPNKRKSRKVRRSVKNGK